MLIPSDAYPDYFQIVHVQTGIPLSGILHNGLPVNSVDPTLWKIQYKPNTLFVKFESLGTNFCLVQNPIRLGNVDVCVHGQRDPAFIFVLPQE